MIRANDFASRLYLFTVESLEAVKIILLLVIEGISKASTEAKC